MLMAVCDGSVSLGRLDVVSYVVSQTVLAMDSTSVRASSAMTLDMRERYSPGTEIRPFYLTPSRSRNG
jgi:hypothetical protein